MAQDPRNQAYYAFHHENLKSHMEEVYFSKALLCTYKATWCHNPEKQIMLLFYH